VQSFAACMSLLTAASTFGLGRRRWSSRHVIYAVSVPSLLQQLFIIIPLLLMKTLHYFCLSSCCHANYRNVFLSLIYLKHFVDHFMALRECEVLHSLTSRNLTLTSLYEIVGLKHRLLAHHFRPTRFSFSPKPSRGGTPVCTPATAFADFDK